VAEGAILYEECLARRRITGSPSRRVARTGHIIEVHRVGLDVCGDVTDGLGLRLLLCGLVT
jgi:hypothetical protein